VNERQFASVQGLAFERDPRRRPAPIDRVTHEWVSEMLEVDANLVRAAGFEPAFDKRCPRQSFDDPVARARLTPPPGDRHTRARPHVAPNRQVDQPACARFAMHDRKINTVHGARGKLAREAGLRLERLGDDQKPARIAIQAMHNARARHPGKRRRVREQRIEQRASVHTRPRVNNQTGGLVENDQIIVLVDDLQWNALGLGRRRAGQGGRGEADRLSAGHRMTWRRRTPIKRDVAVAQPRLEPRARVLREQTRERLIQPKACKFARNRAGHRPDTSRRFAGAIIFNLP